MSTIHPIFVHFPVALFCSALLFEIISLLTKKDFFHSTAVCVYFLASLTSLLAVYTGLAEAQRLHLNHPVLNSHRLFGFITMYISFFSLFVICVARSLPSKVQRIIFFVFSLSMVITVLITGFYGGRMVYEYGVGING